MRDSSRLNQRKAMLLAITVLCHVACWSLPHQELRNCESQVVVDTSATSRLRFIRSSGTVCLQLLPRQLAIYLRLRRRNQASKAH